MLQSDSASFHMPFGVDVTVFQLAFQLANVFSDDSECLLLLGNPIQFLEVFHCANHRTHILGHDLLHVAGNLLEGFIGWAQQVMLQRSHRYHG